MQVNLTSADEYARVARSQKRYAREIAEALARGESLDRTQQEFAAAIMRAWADHLTETPKRPKGRPPKFASGDAALRVMGLVAAGHSRSSAIAQTAEAFDVTVEAITKALKKDGREAFRLSTETGIQLFVRGGGVSAEQARENLIRAFRY